MKNGWKGFFSAASRRDEQRRRKVLIKKLFFFSSPQSASRERSACNPDSKWVVVSWWNEVKKTEWVKGDEIRKKS
jgi:hypothetical protein